MPSVSQPAEFFVVGGPVQPERPCYVERTADRALGEALRTKRLCCVLGARAVGKTSLLLRAGRTLRRAGALVAHVDLRLATERGTDAPDALLRAVARRMAEDLALDIDVESWWQQRGRASGRRFVEFCWEVVLTNTTAQVAVFIDDIDVVVGSPQGAELLAAIGACYARRSAEPDFGRLNFVLAGCTSWRLLMGAKQEPALADAEVIEPPDFSAREMYQLAPAFGGATELGQALLDRIYGWTGGHPYLTQRVARGVSRKGGRLEDVEHVVAEQLLAPGAPGRDPLLEHIRVSLGGRARASRRAVKLLQRLAGGGKASQPAEPAVWERLSLSGTVRLRDEQRLELRNRIVKELVAARWLKSPRSIGRYAAVAAVLLAVLAGAAYWYTQRLPLAATATLADPGSDLAAAEQAYQRLRALPGFDERADGLWLTSLEQRSLAATALADVAALDARLRALPGQEAAADGLFANYWLRRARAATHDEQRDAALLMAQRAAALPAATSTAAVALGELVGDDYRHLERTLRLPSAPSYWHMRFGNAALLSLDAEQRALRTPFGAAAGLGTLGAAPVQLTALVHTALEREVAASGEGTAGELALTVWVEHPAPDELLIRLAAPSGAAAVVTLPRAAGEASGVESFSFQAFRGSPLAELADEGLDGVWRLTVVDRVTGNSGELAGWRLSFGETGADDDFADPLAIPEPTRSEAVIVRAAGERAVVSPAQPNVIGSVAIWNLMTGRLEHDLTLPAPPREVALDARGERVLAATDTSLTLFDAADGVERARVATQTGFALPPVFSADGAYVAIAERVEGANPLYSVLRSDDASLVTSIEGPAGVERWELGPGGSYVALLDAADSVRLLQMRRGAQPERLAHDRPIARLLHAQGSAALVTVDDQGAITSWPLAGSAAREPRRLGRTTSPAGVSIAAEGVRLAFTRGDGAVTVVEATTGRELFRLLEPRGAPAATQLAGGGTALVTQSGTRLRLWSLPSADGASAPRARVVPTTLALDRDGGTLAIGLPSGQLEIRAVDEQDEVGSALAFVGHRGPVTVAAIDTSSGVAVTGGDDGAVRIWDARSGAPTGIVLQPTGAPIGALALDAGARRVASAVQRVVRVAEVADGRVTTEIEAPGEVVALAFAPSDGIAVADATGLVTLVPRLGTAERFTATLGAAATSLAFAGDGSVLAAGDANGAVTLIGVADGRLRAAHRFAQPIRWLEFSPDNTTLLVATDGWLHASGAQDLSTRLSKVVVFAEAAAFAALSSTTVRVAGLAADGALAVMEIDLTKPGLVPADAPALVAREWFAALGLRLDDNGDPVPFDP